MIWVLVSVLGWLFGSHRQNEVVGKTDESQVREFDNNNFLLLCKQQQSSVIKLLEQGVAHAYRWKGVVSSENSDRVTDAQVNQLVRSENLQYDLKLDSAEPGPEELPKLDVKCLYPAALSETIRTLIETDKKVRALELQPMRAPSQRYIIKNKTLFPPCQ